MSTVLATGNDSSQHAIFGPPGFLGKNIYLCILKGILKGKMPSKMHKIIFKKKKKMIKKICVPTLYKISKPI